MNKLVFFFLVTLAFTACQSKTDLENIIADADRLQKKGECVKSVEAYTNIISKQMKFDSVDQEAGVHINRGNCLQQLTRFDEAVSDYELALLLAPKASEAYANRGIAYDSLGKHIEAIADYKKAIELKPKLAEPPGIITRVLWNIQEKPVTIRDRMEFLEEMYKEEKPEPDPR